MLVVEQVLYKISVTIFGKISPLYRSFSTVYKIVVQFYLIKEAGIYVFRSVQFSKEKIRSCWNLRFPHYRGCQIFCGSILWWNVMRFTE